MGADFSKDGATPLSIACVSAITQFDEARFQAFRRAVNLAVQQEDQLSRRVSRSGSALQFMTARSESMARLEERSGQSLAPKPAWRRARDLHATAFKQALDDSEVASLERSVLERVFVLLDPTGEDVVHAVELLVAAATLMKGDISLRVQYAVEVLQDDIEEGSFSIEHALYLLTTMNTVANYFGDPLVSLPLLESIAADVTQSMGGAEIDSDSRKLAQIVAQHPLVVDYVEPSAHE
ncbi:hypothetical protein ATCC90586_003387 [Pythium insidiosum]|nr:hypothetical protein ATCC90586_003387 [Pythium insidiosum]